MSRLRKFLVVTPDYDVVEPVTDEGQGPTISIADVIEIEAESARDAIVLGVKAMLGNPRPGKYERYQWCADARLDGCSPFAGVKAFPVVDEELAVEAEGRSV